jgi:hypothetical protein
MPFVAAMRILYRWHRIPYSSDKGEKIPAPHRLGGSFSAQQEPERFTLSDDANDVIEESAVAGCCRQVASAHIRPKFAPFKASYWFFARRSVEAQQQPSELPRPQTIYARAGAR